MLEINNVTKKFRKKTVLHQLHATLEHGIYGLLGANGAGKTTLLRCVTGLYPLNEGEITWQGENIKSSKSYVSHLGYLPQKFEGLKDLTVTECLEYFGDLKDMDANHLTENIEKVLELVNLSDAARTKVRKLSGGMLRRVGIAQALLDEPELLIFDEPTAGLDPEERLRFKNMISCLDRHKTVIVSTHIVEDIETLCDKIIVMKEGTILGMMTVKEIEEQANSCVYEVPASERKNIKGNYKVVREYRKGNETMVRVLTATSQTLPAVQPTLEDGYLCMISEL